MKEKPVIPSAAASDGRAAGEFPVDVAALREQGYDIVCVLGPTASGKTRLAVDLAVRWSLAEACSGTEGGAGAAAAGEFRPGAEIISADSRQVYTGMDIGTGKDKEEYTVDLSRYRCAGGTGFPLRSGARVPGVSAGTSAGAGIGTPSMTPSGTPFPTGVSASSCTDIGTPSGTPFCTDISTPSGADTGANADACASGPLVQIPCHLTDIVPAGTKYNLFEYRRDFLRAYRAIKNRGRMPILCGGSGLYIEAAVRNYRLQEVPPDARLRAELESKPLEELIALLVDLKAARGEKPHNTTDFDTRKRVIRAIEIERALSGCTGPGFYGPDTGRETGQAGPGAVSPGAVGSAEDDSPAGPLRCKYIGVRVDRETRNRRIDARLERRLQNGLVEEIQGLLDGGIPAEDLIYYGLEYKFVTRYLLGELSYGEMAEKLAVAIHQFAKRQMTWFRGMERRGIDIEWVDWA